MARTKYTPAQIIGMLRETEVRLSLGTRSAQFADHRESPSRASAAGGVRKGKLPTPRVDEKPLTAALFKSEMPVDSTEQEWQFSFAA